MPLGMSKPASMAVQTALPRRDCARNWGLPRTGRSVPRQRWRRRARGRRHPRGSGHPRSRLPTASRCACASPSACHRARLSSPSGAAAVASCTKRGGRPLSSWLSISVMTARNPHPTRPGPRGRSWTQRPLGSSSRVANFDAQAAEPLSHRSRIVEPTIGARPLAQVEQQVDGVRADLTGTVERARRPHRCRAGPRPPVDSARSLLEPAAASIARIRSTA